MKKLGLILLFLGVVMMVGSAVNVSTANAWTVILEWIANTETDLAGYKLYYTQTQGSYDYQTPANVLGAGYTETGEVVPDGFHCWTLTAFDLSGNESPPSEEVCLTLPDDAPLYDITSPEMPTGFQPREVLPSP